MRKTRQHAIEEQMNKYHQELADLHNTTRARRIKINIILDRLAKELTELKTN